MTARETMVRTYLPQDAAGVASLILPIQREEFGIPITLEEQPDLLDIAGFYQKGNGNFWVALSAGRVVGSIGLLDIGNRQEAFPVMAVDSRFYRRGVGGNDA